MELASEIVPGAPVSTCWMTVPGKAAGLSFYCPQRVLSSRCSVACHLSLSVAADVGLRASGKADDLSPDARGALAEQGPGGWASSG